MNPSNESIEELGEDFSQPWKPSDLVLLVEGRKLQVHRDILALNSPVFSKMLEGDFKEKTAQEVPLPDKKFHEIREMLLMIYPTKGKSVDESNCNFLLALAHEYEIRTVIEKCECFMLEVLKSKEGSDILDMLYEAQKYSLQKVLDGCIKKTEELSFVEIKRHPKYGQIEPLSQRKMIELCFLKEEAENKRLKDLASEAYSKWETIVIVIGDHVSGRGFCNVIESLRYIKADENNHDSSRTSKSLGELHEPLRMLGKKLNEIMGLPQEQIE